MSYESGEAKLEMDECTQRVGGRRKETQNHRHPRILKYEISSNKSNYAKHPTEKQISQSNCIIFLDVVSCRDGTRIIRGELRPPSSV